MLCDKYVIKMVFYDTLSAGVFECKDTHFFKIGTLFSKNRAFFSSAARI